MDDVVLLSRLQFAFTIMFHYLFPPLTIGMGVVLVYLEAMYMKTKDPLYETAAKFWTKLFAISFAVGVASGIVMEFQFGTNWARYSRFVGDVFGSALAAEGIFAFFLESGFLAVLVFGWDKVSPRFHLFGTIMVALGSIFSSVWIIVANSWQQTPDGHHIVPVMRDGVQMMINGLPMMRAEVVDFWAVVFNPSTMHRLIHVWIGAFILGSFFIMSISAWYVLKGRHLDFAHRSFRGALIFAAIASLAAPISGHFNADMVAEYQPTKMAALEGHFETGPADLSLFGIPDADRGELRFNIAIPGMLSWLLHGDTNASVPGLNDFKKEDWPPLFITFTSYHLMVALGSFFILLTLLAAYFNWRGTLFDKRWLMWVFVFAVIGPFAANQLGWVAAEVGRQPWIVHPPVTWGENHQLAMPLDADGKVMWEEGVALRTKDGISESGNVNAGSVLASMIMFGIIYALLFVVWLYVLNSKIQAGPQPPSMPKTTTPSGFFEAAAARVEHRDTMTGAKDAPPQPPA